MRPKCICELEDGYTRKQATELEYDDLYRVGHAGRSVSSYSALETYPGFPHELGSEQNLRPTPLSRLSSIIESDQAGQRKPNITGTSNFEKVVPNVDVTLKTALCDWSCSEPSSIGGSSYEILSHGDQDSSRGSGRMSIDDTEDDYDDIASERSLVGKMKDMVLPIRLKKRKNSTPSGDAAQQRYDDRDPMSKADGSTDELEFSSRGREEATHDLLTKDPIMPDSESDGMDSDDVKEILTWMRSKSSKKTEQKKKEGKRQWRRTRSRIR